MTLSYGEYFYDIWRDHQEPGVTPLTNAPFSSLTAADQARWDYLGRIIADSMLLTSKLVALKTLAQVAAQADK